MQVLKVNQSPFRTIFDEIFNDQFYAPAKYGMPSANIHETKDAFILEMSAPGFNKEDIQVKFEHEVLTISGKVEQKVEENDKKWKLREFKQSSFERSFRVGNGVNLDNVEASFENGILKVNLAKKEQEIPLVKTIAVK